MLSNDIMDDIKNLIELVKKYFGKNVTAFYAIPNENGQDFCIECLIYRCFSVSFTE